MIEEFYQVQLDEKVKLLNVTGVDPVGGKLHWTLVVIFTDNTDMEVQNVNLAKAIHTVMRHLGILITKSTCGHHHFANGYCAEMPCLNYYGKQPQDTDPSIIHGSYKP